MADSCPMDRRRSSTGGAASSFLPQLRLDFLLWPRIAARRFCFPGTSVRLVWSMVLLFSACAFCLEAQAAEARPSAYSARRQYVRLSSWAAENNVQIAWTRRDEALRLSRGGRVANLRVDSREARVDGVLVWLLYPLAKQSGRIYISALDLESTLEPLLLARKGISKRPIKTVALDPGHGGRDPGYLVGSRQEKLFTLLLAQELKTQLNRAGFDVVFTRTQDAFVPLEDRPEIARRRGADVFISLHFNSAGTRSAPVRGSEVYCLTPAGAPSSNAAGEGGGSATVGNRSNASNLLLAYHVQRSLVRGLAVEDRGVKRARFAVLRDANMPAVLIEAGFMSHPIEGQKITTPGYRRQMARAIVDGLLAYKGAAQSAR